MNENRSEQISFRLTKSELKHLIDYALAHRQSVQDIMRVALQAHTGIEFTLKKQPRGRTSRNR